MNKEILRQILYFLIVVMFGFQSGVIYEKYNHNIDIPNFNRMNFVIRDDSIILVHPNPNTTEGFQISQKNIIYYEK